MGDLDEFIRCWWWWWGVGGSKSFGQIHLSSDGNKPRRFFGDSQAQLIRCRLQIKTWPMSTGRGGAPHRSGLSAIVNAVPVRRLTRHQSRVAPPAPPFLFPPSRGAPASRLGGAPAGLPLSCCVIRGGRSDEVFVLSANADPELSLSFASHSLCHTFTFFQVGKGKLAAH